VILTLVGIVSVEIPESKNQLGSHPGAIRGQLCSFAFWNVDSWWLSSFI
jgi:hypothetical protein